MSTKKNVISVAKILTPILTQTVSKAVKPAVKGMQKMQSAIRRNGYVQQYGKSRLSSGF